MLPLFISFHLYIIFQVINDDADRILTGNRPIKSCNWKIKNENEIKAEKNSIQPNAQSAFKPPFNLMATFLFNFLFLENVKWYRYVLNKCMNGWRKHGGKAININTYGAFKHFLCTYLHVLSTIRIPFTWL